MPEVLFRAVVVFAAIFDQSFGILAFGGIMGRDGLSERFRFLYPAAEETGSFKVEIEQVAGCVLVGGIESNGFFEHLAGFAGPARSGERTGCFRPASIGSAEPVEDGWIIRFGCEGFFEDLGALLVVAEHEVVLADQLKSRGVFLVLLEKKGKRLMIIRAPVQIARLIKRGNLRPREQRGIEC